MHYIELKDPEKRQKKVGEFFETRLQRTKEFLRDVATLPEQDEVVTVNTLNAFMARMELAQRLTGKTYEDRIVDTYLAKLLIHYIRVQPSKDPSGMKIYQGIFGVQHPHPDSPIDLTFYHAKNLADFLLFFEGYLGIGTIERMFDPSITIPDNNIRTARVTYGAAAKLQPHVSFDFARSDAEACGRVARNFDAAVEVLRTLRTNYNNELENLVA